MLKQIQKFLERCYDNRKGIVIFIFSLLVYIILNQAMNNYIQDKKILELNKPSIWEIYIDWIKKLKKNINEDLNKITVNKTYISILEWNVDKNIRLTGILRSTELLDYFLEMYSELRIREMLASRTSIDWALVSKLLHKLRQDSLRFLRESLSWFWNATTFTQH